MSAVTLVEVLGYHELTESDKSDFKELFELAIIYPLTQEVINKAIKLRQQRRMSLGDSLIAATALVHNKTLATRNTKDFQWIDGLKLLNPLD